MEKTILRKKIKLKLNTLDKKNIEKKSNKILNELKIYTAKYNVWFVFLSMKKEFQTEKLIRYLLKKWKTIVVPQINKNDEMITVEYKMNSILKEWKYWISEIVNAKKYKWKIEIAIIPGLAFTKDWKRLWRWGGYYDRFLGRNKSIFKIWVCFWLQIVDEIFVDGWDVKMDLVCY